MAKTILKKLVSFDVQRDAPELHIQSSGNGYWVVHMHAVNGEDRIDVELKNKQKCPLNALHRFMMEQFTEIVGELSPITDGGFTIYQKE